MQQQAQLMAKAAKAGSGLPKKYADPQTTDLHFTVVEGDNVFEIKLAD